MLRSGLEVGLELGSAQLALIAASHDGTPMHVEIARSIPPWSRAWTISALANTPGLPLDEEAARSVLSAGGGPDRLHHNCSGKHAGMVATWRRGRLAGRSATSTPTIRYS